jgi:hypothetical protein
MAPGSIDPEPQTWQSTVERKKQQQRNILSKALLELESNKDLKHIDINQFADTTQTLSLISDGQLTCRIVVQGLIGRYVITIRISAVPLIRYLYIGRSKFINRCVALSVKLIDTILLTSIN